MEVIKKEWRKAINRNVDYYKKELEIIKRNQVKLEDSFTQTKSELKAINSKLEDRMLTITPSEKQSERQKKGKQSQVIHLNKSTAKQLVEFLKQSFSL